MSMIPITSSTLKCSNRRRCCAGVEMLWSHKSLAPRDSGVSSRAARSSLASSAENDIPARRRRPQRALVFPDDIGRVWGSRSTPSARPGPERPRERTLCEAPAIAVRLAEPSDRRRVSPNIDVTIWSTRSNSASITCHRLTRPLSRRERLPAARRLGAFSARPIAIDNGISRYQK
jgi:hypothetical protein